jgi:hypothetical protein
MFFQESEAIATENLDLRKTVEQVDHLLATIFTNAPLRPEDFAWKLDLDANQVIVVFEILTSCGVLLAESVVECRQCQNLVPLPPLDQAEAQQHGFECSGCGWLIERSAPVVTVYRMTEETLARPKPLIATLSVESALRELDQYPNVFRRLGHYWVIKYDSKMALLHSSGGLSYLARLLVDPGRKIPASFLLAAEMGIDPRIPVGIHACRCYPFRNHRLVRCLGPQKHLSESPESSPYLRFPREIMWFCSGGAGFELGDILPKANLFNTSYLGFRPPDCCVARFPDGFFQILYVACLQVPVTMLPPDPDLFADNIFDHPIRTVDLDQGNLTTSPPRLYFFLKVKRAVFWTFSIVIGGGL